MASTSSSRGDVCHSRQEGLLGDLVVVLNGFPRLSETFVLQELLALERQGARLQIFALTRPEEAVRHEAIARLRAEVEYLQSPVPASALRTRVAHATLALERPS